MGRVVIVRAALLASLILAGGVYARGAGSREITVPPPKLSELPCRVDAWRCTADVPLDRESLAVLRVDEYLNRVYVGPNGNASVLIGYYASQRQGDTIHSPQNCLPGSGWQPLTTTVVDLGRDGDHLPANEMIVQKSLDRQVVVYWYQGRGRRIANDYANKFWLVFDAIRLHRSNGAIVRVVAPTAPLAERFARALSPSVTSLLP